MEAGFETEWIRRKIKVGVLHPEEEGWGCISLSHLGLDKKRNYCCYVLTPTWIVHLPLACSLQGYHGVIHDNQAGSD